MFGTADMNKFIHEEHERDRMTKKGKFEKSEELLHELENFKTTIKTGKKIRNFDIYDKLYKRETNELDYNLQSMTEFLKP